MKEFWNTIQIVFTGIGGWLGYFLGGCDGLLYALLAFVVIDYLTGIMCAINDHTLSSEVGFRGICRPLSAEGINCPVPRRRPTQKKSWMPTAAVAAVSH